MSTNSPAAPISPSAMSTPATTDRIAEAAAHVARLETAYRAAVAEGFRCEIDRLFVALQNARRELRCRQLFA